MDCRQELEQEEPMGQGEEFEFYSDCTRKQLCLLRGRGRDC